MQRTFPFIVGASWRDRYSRLYSLTVTTAAARAISARKSSGGVST
jgi:hypothetical protein